MFVVVFGRIGHSFGGQLLEGTDDAEAGVAWFDYVVDVAEFSRVVGVAEEFVVFRFLLGEHLLGSSDAFASLAYSTSTAPAPPITAISAVGHA